MTIKPRQAFFDLFQWIAVDGQQPVFHRREMHRLTAGFTEGVDVFEGIVDEDVLGRAKRCFCGEMTKSRNL